MRQRFFQTKARRCLHALSLFASLGLTAASAQLFTSQNLVTLRPGESEAARIQKAARVTPSARQLRWQGLELTGFLHFGINTFTNREWDDGAENAALFNPTDFDAKQWIRVLKKAGIRQVILTAKHHDGFCLWPSRYTTHSVKSSPWKEGQGDVVKAVSAACRAYGMGFGIYLSLWDRHAPQFGDSAAYNAYFLNQLTELLTQYGPIAEVWFDGANGEGPGGKKQVYDFNRWYALIRRLQPGAVIAVMGPDVRWVGTETGYGRETEWSVVPADDQLQERIIEGSQKEMGFAPMNRMEDDLGSRSRLRTARALAWYPAEIDVSIRPGWFYHPAEDSAVKSPAGLMDIYYGSVGRNGVLLLNVPPDTRGRIAAADSSSLLRWKALRDRTFRTNFLKGSSIRSANGKAPAALTDGNLATCWTTTGKDTAAIIAFRLEKSARVDRLLLQEAITRGQRIERFVAEHWDGKQWKVLASGTTVGYKRIVKFSPVAVSRFRLRILSARGNPALAEVGLYKEAE